VRIWGNLGPSETADGWPGAIALAAAHAGDALQRIGSDDGPRDAAVTDTSPADDRASSASLRHRCRR
jgi:hypothetical protein